jgi:hypothetical protein
VEKDPVPNLVPVKEAAATRRVTRDLVPEMDLVPRDTRAAVDTETVTEMEAVPRDIRVLAPVMDPEKDLVPNLDLSLMMDTHPWKVIRRTNH